jgi:hypothetical protein
VAVEALVLVLVLVLVLADPIADANPWGTARTT